jgi:dienelactone hydrolase
MTAKGADWQLHVFGGVGHSDTNPAVDALGRPGFAYHAAADRRSWSMMLALLLEEFGSLS